MVVALASMPCSTWAQGGAPVGPEFRVNTFTTGHQAYPSIGTDSVGNFVVAWTGYEQDGSLFGIFGQRYSSAGLPLGPEFRVNTYTTNQQYVPSVARSSAGSFVVAWMSVEQDGSYHGIFGRRYASDGTPVGGEFRVNTFTTGGQVGPSVTADSAGNLVIVWYGYGPGDPDSGIFGQRYASAGVPVGPEFRVNTYVLNLQQFPSVASDGAGNFVVVWESEDADGSYSGIFGQRYSSGGIALGAEFRVNSYTTSFQVRPSVARDPSGNFVVVWLSTWQDGSGLGVFGQRYSSTGLALGPEFRVNTYTTGSQFVPRVAFDAAGNFVVVWTSNTLDDPQYGTFGQRYASSGIAVGSEFRVNTYTTFAQWLAAVSADAAGNFVVAWDSALQDGSGRGIYAQRHSQILPVELMRFGLE